MDEDSRSIIHDLKKEWKLFWNNFRSEGFRKEDEPSTESDPLFPADITLGQLQGMTRNLSRQRHEIHQKLETIQKEIDELEALLDEQRISGKKVEETVRQIEKLNDLGQKWSEAIDLLTEQLKLARQKEAVLLAEEKELNPSLRRRAQGV